MSEKAVAIARGGETIALEPGEGLLRPPQSLWSLYLKDVRDGDRVLVGTGEPIAPFPERTAPPTYPAMGPAPGLQDLEFRADAAPSTSWEANDSFAGFDRGARWTFGVRFAPSPGSPWAAATPARFGNPSESQRAVFLLYSAGDGPPPALVAADGSPASPGPDLEALAWRAWPPLRTAKILLGRYPIARGAKAEGFDPRGRLVIAATALRDGAPEATATRIAASLERGAAEWARLQAEDRRIASLRGEIATLPDGAIALLPPKAAGPAAAFLGRLGLGRKIAALSPTDLVDPAILDAKRVRVALYAAGEDYVHTVRSAGDGAEAVARYVREGGTLVVLAAGPWPLF